MRSHEGIDLLSALCVRRCVCIALLAASSAFSQQASPPVPKEITIVRKPGQEDGEAQMGGDKPGKIRKIAPHAVAVWPVRSGEGALVLILHPTKGATPKQYALRYYDLDSGRRRELGLVPFNSGTVVETKSTGDGWAFALSGVDVSKKAQIVVGDDQATTGRIADATSPVFEEAPESGRTAVGFQKQGVRRTAALGVLLGTDLSGIYVSPETGQTAPKYLQVFPSGDALIETKDGAMAKGRWQTDGETVEVSGLKPSLSLPLASLVAVKGVPAGQRFGIRLTQELSSRTTHEHDTVKAVSITPVVVGSDILIPAGSELRGIVTQADSVGWGFKHETASLTIKWMEAKTPDGHLLAMDARVFAVENAQEKVNSSGKIQGIRSTGTIGHTAENGVLSFAGIDPVAYIFASASGSAVLGFAEPEILYHGGTELILETIKPLITSTVYPPSVGSIEHDAAGEQQLQAMVKGLPYRTRTKGSNKVSDLTNLIFIGEPAAVQRAFAAAGWLPTDDLYAASTFRTVKTLTGNETYKQAPMSMLLLDEREPDFALSKTTNTFMARHHLRVYPTTESYRGQTVLTSSSTQDIGIAFSRKQKTFIHVIDQRIDNERSKVVNDLMFTGCVESLDMVNRPWVPHDAFNSTGDRLLTDGAVAVMKLNSCDNPRTTAPTEAPPPNRAQRITRDTALTIRNDVYRANLIYTGIQGFIAARNYFRSANELPPDTGAWRKTDASGSDYKGIGTNPGLQRREHGGLQHESSEAHEAPSPEDAAYIRKAKEDHKWDPPRYEFALQGGYVHMREDYLSAVGVLETSTNPTAPTYFLFLVDDVGDGWAAGGSVTVNSWKHFSNEFSYFRQQVKYKLGTASATIPAGTNVILDDSDIVATPIGLVTRQFEYNLLIHATRPASRWRPYAAVGPVLQLVALNGAPLKKPAGPFSVGLKNIGLIKAAFDFGNTRPLDGGGIFHIGLQYGAGIKYRVHPRVMLRADWRETWAKNPDIIADSYKDYDSNILDDTYTTDIIRQGPVKKFVKDRFTLGVGFTF